MLMLPDSQCAAQAIHFDLREPLFGAFCCISISFSVRLPEIPAGYATPEGALVLLMLEVALVNTLKKPPT